MNNYSIYAEMLGKYLNNKTRNILIKKAGILESAAFGADLLRNFDIGRLQPVIKRPNIEPRAYDPRLLKLIGTQVIPMAAISSLLGKKDPLVTFNELIRKMKGQV